MAIATLPTPPSYPLYSPPADQNLPPPSSGGSAASSNKRLAPADARHASARHRKAFLILSINVVRWVYIPGATRMVQCKTNSTLSAEQMVCPTQHQRNSHEFLSLRALTTLVSLSCGFHPPAATWKSNWLYECFRRASLPPNSRGGVYSVYN